MLELEIINFKQINESTNVDIMTQIEEDKKKEESQKIQLTKKEEACQMLELEAINLKRIQVGNKEDIKRLKNEFIDLTFEVVSDLYVGVSPTLIECTRLCTQDFQEPPHEL